MVYEAFNWRHGVFVGSAMRSESTAAAEHKGEGSPPGYLGLLALSFRSTGIACSLLLVFEAEVLFSGQQLWEKRAF